MQATDIHFPKPPPPVGGGVGFQCGGFSEGASELLRGAEGVVRTKGAGLIRVLNFEGFVGEGRCCWVMQCRRWDVCAGFHCVLVSVRGEVNSRKTGVFDFVCLIN